MRKNKQIKIWCFIGCVCVLGIVLWNLRTGNRDDASVTENKIIENSRIDEASYPLLEVSEIESDMQEEKIKNLSYEEAFEVIRGKWEVAEYLGEATEYHGVDLDDPEYQESQKKNREYVFQEYFGKRLEIDEKNIVDFMSRSDGKFIYETYNELFTVVRNPASIAYEPPFFIASVQLEGYAEQLTIIKSADDVFFFTVRGLFFKLNKIEQD